MLLKLIFFQFYKISNKFVVCLLQGINYFEEASIPLLSDADEVLIHVKAGSLDPIDIHIALGHGKVLRELFNNSVLVGTIFPSLIAITFV